MKYVEESFGKFNNPADPLYEDYKDRKIEEATDNGFNNGIDAAISIIQNL